MQTDFLNRMILSMTLLQWLILLGSWLSVVLVLVLINRLLVGRVSRFSAQTKNVVDNYLAIVLGQTKLFFLCALGLYLAAKFVEVSDPVAVGIEKLTFVLLLFQVILWLNKLITVHVDSYKERMVEEDAGAVTTVQAVGFLGRLVLYTVVFLLALDNFGVRVTALIASLGIGGIAVALAIQNILGDLFASLSILLDKPFVVGDFLIVGEYLGTVENVGLKTTRIRSLSGEQIIFSNNDLLNSRIRNYRRMYERRVPFSIGVTYQTTQRQLEAIPGILKEIVEAQEQVRFERAHLKEFGDFAITFEIVYYVLVPDYTIYMDIQQAINLLIYGRLEKEGIAFAYPTQTLHVESIRADTSSIKD